jgi:hypothetical protein
MRRKTEPVFLANGPLAQEGLFLSSLPERSAVTSSASSALPISILKETKRERDIEKRE